MQYSYYQIKAPYEAGHVDNPQNRKQFAPGNNEIVAAKWEQGVLVTPDGYVLPAGIVDPLSGAQKTMEPLRNLTGKEMVDKMMHRNKFSINGAMAGFAVGLFYGFLAKRSLVWCCMIGTGVGLTGGFLISKIIPNGK